MTQEHHQNPLLAHLARVSADLAHDVDSLRRDRHTMTTKLDCTTRAFVQGKLSASQDSIRRVSVASEIAEYEITKLVSEREEASEESLQLQSQIEQLGAFIMATIPGEPSQSQGAVDTAIRVLGEESRLRAQAEAQLREANGTMERMARKLDEQAVQIASLRGEDIPVEIANRLGIAHVEQHELEESGTPG